MEYCRIGPTPWLRTSQPASVSIGEPQFPICTISHGNAGARISLGSYQKCTLSEKPGRDFHCPGGRSWRRGR